MTETLMSLKGWEIRRETGEYTAGSIYNKGELWGYHIVCDDRDKRDGLTPSDAGSKYSWFITDAYPNCVLCGALVPDEIQALIILESNEI